MPFVLMQRELEPPRMEQLKAAFRGIPGLTPLDAPILCKDSLGILVRGLGQDEAWQLQAALAAQGVETEVADQAALPILPPITPAARLDCAAEGLMVGDKLGRTFSVEWKDVALIAAGRVSVIEFKRVSSPAILPGQGGGLALIDEVLFRSHGWSPPGSLPAARPNADYHTVEELHERWMAEVMTRDAGMRLHVEAEVAALPLFQYLGERRTEVVAENFKLLVQDLCRFAPGAAINRGAYYLCVGNAAAFAYPGKNGFYDEMVWLLWRLARAGPKPV